MKTATMTVRISQETKARINDLALSINRPKSYILDQAINDYLNVHEWQVVGIKKAVQQANSPNAKWTSHDDVKKAWETKLEN